MASALTTSAAYINVQKLAEKNSKECLKHLLKDDARNTKLCKNALGVTVDFSRQLVDTPTLDALLALAKERQVPQKIQKMFEGEHINHTEDRPVLHVALRMPETEKLTLGDKNVVGDVHSVLKRIYSFAQAIRTGQLVGYTGNKLTNLVCIGIGGSYLGSEFISEALSSHPASANAAQNRCIRFLANVDPIDIYRALKGLDATRTLVCVISKTFTTAETMLNAKSLREWIIKELGDEKALANHLCAVSTNLELTSKFGIPNDRVFEFWDFVGGRYSVTSAVGLLPLAIHYGPDIVSEFLRGCHDMDKHFRQTDISENLPALMGLMSFYNSTLLDLNCVAVLPYCQALHRFAAHIQQLTMESNGKGVDSDGNALAKPAGEIFFGEPGTNGQHSFYQLLHQGRIVPAEFIGFVKSQQPISVGGETVTNHDELMCNFFAQPDALAYGKTSEELRQEGVHEKLVGHKTFSGNRPSTVILMPECDPYYLGVLLALYEHRTAVQGFLWGINSFDQWGVELGKVLAKGIRGIIADQRSGKSPNMSSLPGPTRTMLEQYLKGQ